MTLDEIIEALEKATGPDRELGVSLHMIAFPKDDRGEYELTKYGCAATYTLSIDSALTLVPEGWHGRIWIGDVPAFKIANENRSAFWSNNPRKRESFFGIGGTGVTPAISTCIAALKARKALPHE